MMNTCNVCLKGFNKDELAECRECGELFCSDDGSHGLCRYCQEEDDMSDDEMFL